ncbi:MAG: hypothetical protein AAB832_00195 [Patescibacteria group bacterium]
MKTEETKEMKETKAEEKKKKTNKKKSGKWWILGGSIAAIVFLVVIAIATFWKDGGKLESRKAEKEFSAPARVAETVSEIKRPIIWSKWKEVSLTNKWSEYIDTPTKKDRIVPPKKGIVEVLYENGAYFELEDTSSDDKYEVIDIQMDGKFRLKGSPGTKATIWIGKQS